MLKHIILPVLITFSFGAIGAVDYSLCEDHAPDLRGRINPQGEISARHNERIKSKKELKNGDIEVTFTSTDPRAFTRENKVTFKRDEKGNITGTRKNSDYSKMSKQERAFVKTNEAYMLAHGHYRGMCIRMGVSPISPDGLGSSGGGGYIKGDCSTVSTWVDDQQRYVDPNTINESNFSQLKLPFSWAQFKKMRDADNKMFEEKKKVAKAYEKLMDTQGWAFYSGEEIELGFQDGKCFTKKVSHLMTDGRTGAITNMEMYNADQCDKMLKVLSSHKEKLTQCSLANQEFENDFWKDVYNTKAPLNVEIFVDHRGGMGGGMGGVKLHPLERQTLECGLYKQATYKPTDSGQGENKPFPSKSTQQ